MGLREAVHDAFENGVVLLAPLIVTVIVLKFVAQLLLLAVNPLVDYAGLSSMMGERLFVQLAAGMLLILLIPILGAVYGTDRGRSAIKQTEKVLSVIPIIHPIYATVRRLTDSVTGKDTRFERMVLVEYPREGMYAIGMVTGKSPESLRGEQELLNVFLPNSPNPTGGRLVLVPEDNVRDVDVDARDGLELLMRSGVQDEAEE